MLSKLIIELKILTQFELFTDKLVYKVFFEEAQKKIYTKQIFITFEFTFRKTRIFSQT